MLLIPAHRLLKLGESVAGREEIVKVMGLCGSGTSTLPNMDYVLALQGDVIGTFQGLAQVWLTNNNVVSDDLLIIVAALSCVQRTVGASIHKYKLVCLWATTRTSWLVFGKTQGLTLNANAPSTDSNCPVHGRSHRPYASVLPFVLPPVLPTFLPTRLLGQQPTGQQPAACARGAGHCMQRYQQRNRRRTGATCCHCRPLFLHG